MKTSRIVIFVAAALVVGFLTARWCFAQPAHQPVSKGSETDSYIGLHELESFVAYLQDNKQTNILQRFNEYGNVTIVSRSSADLGVRLHILYALRGGRTNEAIRMLEGQMTSDVVGFATSYHELPVSILEKVSLKAFQEARDYCSKYAVKNGNPDIDAILEKAFALLDEKSTH